MGCIIQWGSDKLEFRLNLVQFLFLIPLNNPHKAYGMDGVVKIIPRRSSRTGIIEEFGFNSVCNQTLNKSANPPQINLKQRNVERLAFGLWSN